MKKIFSAVRLREIDSATVREEQISSLDLMERAAAAFCEAFCRRWKAPAEVENAIRPLALGRKNYLFCGNHDAAVRAAIVYSLVDSCKALDVNPREWMEDILLRIPGNENNREALRELLPDKWAKQTN